MIRIFKLFCMSVAVALTLTTSVLAQWSIGQRGTREPPQGQNRYVYLVMSDPLPGREFDFKLVGDDFAVHHRLECPNKC